MHSEPGKWLNEFQKLILVELEKCLNELKLVLLTRSITSLMALPSESESSRIIEIANELSNVVATRKCVELSI